MNQYVLDKILNFVRTKLQGKLWILAILISASFSGIFTYHLHELVKHWVIIHLYHEYDLIPGLGIDAVGLTVWLVIFLLLAWLLDSVITIYLVCLASRQTKCTINFKNITSYGFERDWIIQGSPVVNQGGLWFTNSNSGCLINPNRPWPFSKNLRMWKAFKAQIIIEFPKVEGFNRTLGIIFRAQSLEDYYMIELWRENNKDVLEFRPHIRMSGNWDAPILNSPKTLSVKPSQSLVTLNLNVTSDVMRLTVDNVNFFEWSLPSKFEANLIQHVRKENGDKNKIEDAAVVKVPFRNKAGMFGFRNYGNELAVIKSLTIEPIFEQSVVEKMLEKLQTYFKPIWLCKF